MPAVSNSGPLILYAGVGHLDLLHAVFGEVIVPLAVWYEVVVEGSGRPGAAEIARQPWINRQDVGHQGARPTLLSALGPGEAEAIALAVRLGGKMPILLDNRKARRIAQGHGLRIIGSAGLLVVAKERGLVRSVRPLLNGLRGVGLYLNGAAEQELLSIAGELSDDPGATSNLDR